MTALLDPWRRAYADVLRETAGLRSDRLVDALAAVPRERFLAPGPWLVIGAASAGPAHAVQPRLTPSDDPREIHQDVSVAIDPSRALYNGQPSLVAGWIDALDIQTGDRILHVGCGTGYYTAILAHMTGPKGQVVAVEADEHLAVRARANLADRPWVRVLHGHGRTALPAPVDVLLVHAGASHVRPEWLDLMADNGRLLVPLTCTMPGMPPTLSKGVVMTARRDGDHWPACAGAFVMIYSLLELRDETANLALGRALGNGSLRTVQRLRRDDHPPESSCVVHGAICLSA